MTTDLKPGRRTVRLARSEAPVACRGSALKSERERLAIIHNDESRRNLDAHMARLRAVSEKIEELQAALPQPVDTRLAHYLQRHSYGKALELLENS